MHNRAFSRHPLSGFALLLKAMTAAVVVSPALADPIELSPVIPPAITFSGDASLAGLQDDFDVLSWQTFVALNWPADAQGQPIDGAVIGQDPQAAKVWDSWKLTTDVFLPGGAKPAPWGQSGEIPKACENLAKDGMRVLSAVGKTTNLLQAFNQPFKTGPIIDQDGNYSRFGISLNRSMFDYIDQNGLYSKQGQAQFTQDGKDVEFACSDKTQQGAIMAKSSWRILPESMSAERKARFVQEQVLVYTPAGTDPVTEESCTVQTVGLVGLHIGHKTTNTPQWVWSTFEQIDNVPERGSLAINPHYNYYKAGCTDCLPVNTPPPRPWVPNSKGTPAQVMRMIPITDATKTLNSEWQTALAKVNKASPFQFYELISTQWPTVVSKACNGLDPTNPAGTPAPQFLANSTLETYIQGEQPNVSSSCIECHNNATDTQGKFSDFTFVLEQAQ